MASFLLMKLSLFSELGLNGLRGLEIVDLGFRFGYSSLVLHH